MLDKFSKYASAISLMAVAVLAISPIAHAEPIHMACSGQTRLPNGRLDPNSVLSLTVDMNVGYVGTVTVGGYPPMEISGILGSNDTELHFFALLPGQGTNYMIGSLNRITGHLFVNFNESAPKGQEELFGGTCKPAQKLF